MPKHPEGPWTGTKKDFITSMSSSLPNEIVAAGKEHGLKLTLAHVYAVRSLVRRQTKKAAEIPSKKHGKRRKKRAKVAQKAHPRPAARSPRKRGSRPSRPASSAASRFPSSRTEARDAGRDAEAALVFGSFDEEKLENLLKAAAAMLGIPRALRVLEDGRNIAMYTLLKALPQ